MLSRLRQATDRQPSTMASSKEPTPSASSPSQNVPLLETHQPRRCERARFGARRLDGCGRREVDPHDAACTAVLRQPPRHTPGAAAHVDDAPPAHVAKSAEDQGTLPFVPDGVEGIRRPKRPCHSSTGRCTRVPIGRRAVDGIARPTLLEKLPHPRRACSVGRRLRHAFASTRESKVVSI